MAGGKGANLGELVAAGFNVPPGFVLTTAAYDHFMESSKIGDRVKDLLEKVDASSETSLQEASTKIRELFDTVEIPADLKEQILTSHKSMFKGKKMGLVAVRSSATAEDLPTASFAGQQDTYLNVESPEELLDKVRKCWSSLYTPRAIYYRVTKGFEHSKVKLAVVVQKMINSEISGIMFTVDPNSEMPHIIIEAGYGLGEALVGGKVTPDTYVVDKFHDKILNKRIAKQNWKLVRGKDGECEKADVPEELRNAQKMTDEQILALGEIGRNIEAHYDRPMDIEWCIEERVMYIVQARPVTTLSSNGAKANGKAQDHGLGQSAKILLKGLGASPGVAGGPVRIVSEDMNLEVVKKGDVLVTSMTSPDMVPAMTRAAAIVTDEGGMTCHAAIVARELGIPCIVGASHATELLKDGEKITVDGSM
ncbi:MAG TPA: PEP/pyruvate-binding domain-containing protein, partial [Methanomassiliicoccales archaeon]|nr:PEP/pyruvate-binding domain-containing protein [Methanomassiliicoccales archaeon]